MSNGDSEPSLDTALQAVSDRQRRLICLLLRESEPRPVSDFLRRSAELSHTADTDLYHNHLPRLAELEYIEWDRDAGEVAKGDRFTEIKSLLDILDTHAGDLPGMWP